MKGQSRPGSIPTIFAKPVRTEYELHQARKLDRIRTEEASTPNKPSAQPADRNEKLYSGW